MRACEGITWIESRQFIVSESSISATQSIMQLVNQILVLTIWPATERIAVSQLKQWQ